MLATPPLDRRDRGFSFIELLAYMAIAALLILAAIPQFNQYRQKALVSNLQNDVHNAALDAESAKIGTVSRNTPAPDRPIIRLAADTTTSTLDMLQAAVDKAPRSKGNSLTVALTTDAQGYTITGANAATPYKAVFASSLTKIGPYMLSPGITVIDGSGAPVGGAPTLAAPDATNSTLCAATRDAGSASYVGISADGKTVFSPTYNSKKYTAAAGCKGTWSSTGNSGASSITAVAVSDSGRVVGVDGVNKRLLTANDSQTGWSTVATFDTYAGTPFISTDGDSLLVSAGQPYLVSGLNSGSAKQSTFPLGTPDGTTSLTILGASSDLKTIVVKTPSGLVYRSTDGGAKWTDMTTAANKAIGYSGGFLGMYGNLSTTVSKSGGVVTMMGYTKTDATMVVLQSRDGGATFTMKALPENTSAFKNNPVAMGVSQDGMTLVLASTFDATAGVWASSDAGSTWTRLASDRAQSIAMSDDGHAFMLAGTDGGTRFGTM